MRRREFLPPRAVALPVAVRSQQPSIWTIESFKISREPCVGSPRRRSASTARSLAGVKLRSPQRGVICGALDPR
jgi:hypothetical protein